MTLAELCFKIDPKTGRWMQADMATVQPPFIRFERREVLPGERYPVRHPSGLLMGDTAPFPPRQTHKVVQILRNVDGREDESLYYGVATGTPADHIDTVDNA